MRSVVIAAGVAGALALDFAKTPAVGERNKRVGEGCAERPQTRVPRCHGGRLCRDTTRVTIGSSPPCRRRSRIASAGVVQPTPSASKLNRARDLLPAAPPAPADEAMIAEINAGNHGWTAGVNERFAGYTLVRGGRLVGPAHPYPAPWM
jgi:hypothetical protein